jgi:Rrf2 family protein
MGLKCLLAFFSPNYLRGDFREMFKLSRGAEYAVRGLLYLSSQEEGKVSFIEEISEAQDVPRAYLAKIFQTLAKKGLVKSYRGPEGGFALVRKPAEISMLEVIETMEGPMHLNDCLIHAGFCHREESCPVHDVWAEAQKKLMDFLANSNFEELAKAGKEKAQRKAEKETAQTGT